MDNRFGDVSSVVGYAILTVGVALILHPAARDVACAAVLGALVGALRRLGEGRRTVETLMPFLASTCVAAIVALAVKYDVTDPGLRAIIASLVVFIPGVALTTAFLELTEGQMVAGSSRLVWGGTQLGLLAFGIVVGIGMVGVPAERAFSSSDALLGSWAPWLGVLVFAVGVTIAHSAPPGSFPSLLVVLYAAWIGQVVGNALFGAYASGFTGALVDDRRRLSPRPPTVGDAGVRRLPVGVLAARPRRARPDRPHDGARDPRVRVDRGHPRDRRVDRVRRTRRPLRRRAPRLADEGRRPSAAPRANGLRARGALASGRSALYSVTVRVAIVAVVVGVFCTWLAQGHVTLSGIEGPNNGWLCVLLAAPAFLWARSIERGSWVGVVGVLGCAFVIAWTATENWLDASRVLNAGVSHGLLLVLAACTVVAAVAVVHAVALVRDPAPHVRTGAAGGRARTAVAVTVLMLALLLVLVFRQVLGITQRPSWPPPANAVTAERAETATEAFAARDGTRPARREPRLRLVDRRDDRAVGRGRDVLPADLRGRGGGAVVRPHPHVRLARGRGRDGDGRPARAEARGGCRGAGDRRRLRLPAVRRGARDVHCASRTRERRSSSTTCSRSTATVSTRTIATSTGARTRWAAPTTASST